MVTKYTKFRSSYCFQKCGPGPKCGDAFKVIKFDDDDRQYILDIHNYLRNKVALGYEKRSKQPTASNMNAMSYNMELEFIGQCWANMCNGDPLRHDVCRRTGMGELERGNFLLSVGNFSRYGVTILIARITKDNKDNEDKEQVYRFLNRSVEQVNRFSNYEHVGQNLGLTSSSAPDIDIVKSVKDLILLWYDEVTYFNNSWINKTREREVKVGHYTQLIWADSREIGCAAAYYSTGASDKIYHFLFVCNYGPGGNYINFPVYKIGKPCSKCPGGLKPNGKYKGLCGKIHRWNKTESFDSVFFS
ncbi:hypothetical protein NQ317_007034 [Molorchus minor]|uniref:SCP domain-containing protein n=1 Tax=Molorchus minor TaxID=1323400 RepID=A0ABQ9IZP4_9CUCU|nr:hypothetical protein NQ317_007034 [Molorchus minor]